MHSYSSPLRLATPPLPSPLNASTNILDLHMTGIPVLANLQGARDMGIGDKPALKMVAWVTTTFTSGGAGTLQAISPRCNR